MLTDKAVRKEHWEEVELKIKTLAFTHGSIHPSDLDN